VATIRSAQASGSIPEDVVAHLADMAVPAEYVAGQAIVREGDEVPYLGWIETGRVALRLDVPGRGTVTVLTIEAGDVIGWQAVVSPCRATANALAVEPTRIVTYDAVALRYRLAAHPEIAASLMPSLLAGLSDRLTASWHQLLDVFEVRVVEPW
jgi:CRP-like cAMP-binding protein